MAAKWKELLGKLAPSVARAVGGPLAGEAVGSLSRLLLGKEGASDAELDVALEKATPEQLLKLKEMDQAYVLKLADIAVQIEQAETEDRANARKRETETHDLTTRILAYAIVALFGVTVYMLYHTQIPEPNRDAANQVLGILYAAVGQVLGYYFGSSSGSRAKDAVIGRMSAKP